MLCYGAITYFAVSAWFKLRRMEKQMDEVKYAAMTAMAVTMGEHLRQSFNEINRMQDQLRSLVEQERYEEAERMKSFISDAQQSAMREMKKFKQHFGEDICDVNVMNIHVNSGKEDGE